MTRRSMARLLALSLVGSVLGALLLSACGSDTVLRPGSDAGSDVSGPHWDLGDPPDETNPEPDAATPDASDPDAPRDDASRPDAPEPTDAAAPDAPADLPHRPDAPPADAPAGPDGAGDALPADLGGDAAPPPPLRLDVEVEETVPIEGWAFVDRCLLRHAALTPETFIAKTRHTDADIIAGFGGDAAPAPGRFLLHGAVGQDTPGAPAVLLVHGAGSNATQSFLNPDPLGLEPGLATTLAAAGHAVFAVTFAARYGDNINQGLAVAAALQEVRRRTGADSVAIVAHSMGGIAVLTYLLDRLQPMGVGYLAGEVGHTVLVGVPLGGLDFSFRHPAFNYGSAVWGFEMPSSWDQMLLYGVWQDTYADSIYGGAYTGILQTLRRWDEEYPLSGMEQDWYTTYEGGQGFVSHSLGIDAAIEMGGYFMAELRSATAPAGLSFSVLAGTNPLVGTTMWETSGPSDALVFVASATDTAWLEAAGATVSAVVEILENHWELIYAEEAASWIASALAPAAR